MRTVCARMTMVMASVAMLSWAGVAERSGAAPFVDGQSASLIVGQRDAFAVDAAPSAFVVVEPSCVAVSPQGRLAVGAQARGAVWLWAETPETNGAPADIVVGKNGFGAVDHAVPSAANLGSVEAVCFGAGGQGLIVADGLFHRVLIWNGWPTNTGQPADVVVGQDGFDGAEPGTGRDRLRHPTGVLVTRAGALLIADGGNNRVLIFDEVPRTNGAPASRVLGQPDFGAFGRGSSATRMHRPMQVTEGLGASVLVCDEGNHRVLVFESFPTTNGAAATRLLGQPGWDFKSAGLSATNLAGPAGIAVAGSGRVAVSQFAGHRVSVWNSWPAGSNPAASAVLGQQSWGRDDAFVPDGVPASHNMAGPMGAAFDTQGRLWVALRGANRVMRFGEATGEADVAVAVRIEPGAPWTNSLATVWVTVTNAGPQAASGLAVGFDLPAGLSPEGPSATSQGTYVSGQWMVGGLAARAGATMQVPVRVVAGPGALVTVSAAIDALEQEDPRQDNNAAASIFRVQPVLDNEPPTIAGPTSLALLEDTSSEALNVVVADPDGDPIRVRAQTSDPLIVAVSGVTVEPESGLGSARTLRIRPVPDAFGSAVVRLLAEDGLGGVATQAVEVTVTAVNDRPVVNLVATNLNVLRTAGPQQLAGFAQAHPGATNEIGQHMQFSLSLTGAATFVTAPALDATGQLTFEPDPAAPGGQSLLTVTVRDDGGTDNGGADESEPMTCVLRVRESNAAPVALSFATNGVEDIALSLRLGAVDPDPGEILSYQVGPPQHGTLSGSAPDLVYTPAPDFAGADGFEFTVSDGIAVSAPATVTIQIAPVNDPPWLAGWTNQLTVNEDGIRAVELVLWDPDDASNAVFEVAAEPSDLAGDARILFDGPQTNGARVTWLWSAQSNAFGTGTVELTVSDGSVATVYEAEATVNPVNDAPRVSVNGDAVVSSTNGAVTLSAWIAWDAGPTNEAGQTVFLSVTNDRPNLFVEAPAVVGQSGGEASVRFVPQPGATGLCVIAVWAEDDGGHARGGTNRSAVSSFMLTLLGPDHSEPNRPPVAFAGSVRVLEDGLAELPLRGADPDGDPLLFLVNQPDQGLVSGFGSNWTFRPNAHHFGSDAMTFAVSDGRATSALATVAIEIAPVNDAPSFAFVGSRIERRDTDGAQMQTWAINISPGPANESDQSVQFDVTHDAPALFGSGPSLDSAGLLRFAPQAGVTGVATVSVALQDNGGTSDGGVAISESQQFVIAILGDSTGTSNAPAIADWNGDGWTDVLLQRGREVSVAFCRDGALLSNGPVLATLERGEKVCAAADVNGDRMLDLIVSKGRKTRWFVVTDSGGGAAADLGTLVRRSKLVASGRRGAGLGGDVFIQKGRLVQRASLSISGWGDLEDILTTKAGPVVGAPDLDASGGADLIFVKKKRVSIAWNRTGTGFEDPVPGGDMEGKVVAAAEFSGDASGDVLVARKREVHRVLGSGAGTWVEGGRLLTLERRVRVVGPK